MSPRAVRPLALVAMVGGELYVVLGAVQLASTEQADPFFRTSDYLIQILLVLSLLLTLAGFVEPHLRQAGVYSGPRGWTGYRALPDDGGAMLAAAVVSLATGGLTLGFLYFAGVCLLLVGLALLPVATYSAGILPHWSAYLVGALAAIIFGGFGTVVVGLAWIALAYVLWSERDARARTVL
jgi:hypothetical protein